MRVIIISILALVAGCGSYSQARYDDLANFKRNHAADTTRALEGKLSAPELRASLHSLDVAMLAELAHKGADADLDGARKRLEAESDKTVAGLFKGDTGR